MQKEDRTQFISTILFLFAVSVLIWFLVRHADFNKTVDNTASLPIAPTPVIYCGHVLKVCSVSVSERTDVCKRRLVRRRLEDLLSNPLSDEKCQVIEAEMRNGCPDECRADYSTLIAIPGKVQIDYSPKRDESGRCLIKGERSVSMKLKCVQN